MVRYEFYYSLSNILYIVLDLLFHFLLLDIGLYLAKQTVKRK